MKYLDKSFSVSMPSGVRWPFKPPTAADLAHGWATCPTCGRTAAVGETHYDARDPGPRRRVCFGTKG